MARLLSLDPLAQFKDVDVENAMNAKERLQAVQAALVERGVVDVKFFFNLGDNVRLANVASDVALFLEAVVAQEFVDLEGIGDKVAA